MQCWITERAAVEVPFGNTYIHVHDAGPVHRRGGRAQCFVTSRIVRAPCQPAQATERPHVRRSATTVQIARKVPNHPLIDYMYVRTRVIYIYHSCGGASSVLSLVSATHLTLNFLLVRICILRVYSSYPAPGYM